MLTGPLALIQTLPQEEPWSVALQRTKGGGRVWRLYLAGETLPRYVIHEPGS